MTERGRVIAKERGLYCANSSSSNKEAASYPLIAHLRFSPVARWLSCCRWGVAPTKKVTRYQCDRVSTRRAVHCIAMLVVLSYIDPVLVDCLCILSTASAFPWRIAHLVQLSRFIALFAGYLCQLLFLLNFLPRHGLVSLCLARHVVVIVDVDDVVNDKSDKARKYKLQNSTIIS